MSGKCSLYDLDYNKRGILNLFRKNEAKNVINILNRSVREMLEDFDFLDEDKAFEVMRVAIKNRSEQAGASLARTAKVPGFTRFFLAMWGPVARKSFGEASGFKNVFYPKKKGEFCMDITQCPYHTYLTELGCPEINKLFCDNDIYNYGNIPGLEFIRTKTIGNGDELCDFRLRLK